MPIEPIWLLDRRLIPEAVISVAYTRHLTSFEDGIEEVLDGVEAARRLASAVTLRVDITESGIFSEDERLKILAFPPLKADRRGVVRVQCGQFDSRPKNLSAAREKLAVLIDEALNRVEESPEPKKKRRRAGLIKKAKPE